MVDLTFIPMAAMYYAEPAEYPDGTYTNNPTAPRWCTYSSPMKSRYYGVHHGDIGPHQYLYRRWVAVPMTLSDRSETPNNVPDQPQHPGDRRGDMYIFAVCT